jgi:hypothetical protein
MAALWLFIVCVACLAGCRPSPSFAPPPQKQLPEGAPPPLVRTLIQMNDPDAEAFIVSGVRPGSGIEYRWTLGHATFRLWPDDPNDRSLFLRLALPYRGPVTVAVRVNQSEVARPVFTEARSYDFLQPVAANLLTPPVIVELDVSPLFTDPRDGTKLGVMVAAVGLMKTRR